METTTTDATMNSHTHAAPDGAQAKQPPVVICVAPNGARRTRKDHPALPMTAAELGAEAAACVAAGASVMHLHVRNEQGSHSLDVDRYRAAIDSVHACTQGRLLVQVTTEAVGIYQPAQQMQVVKALRPAAASVAIRELVPDASAHADAVRFFDQKASRSRRAAACVGPGAGGAQPAVAVCAAQAARGRGALVDRQHVAAHFFALVLRFCR